MRPKPLHRSISFWSGLFVMLFVLWAWWDSARFSTGAVAAFIRVYSGPGLVIIDGPTERPVFHLIREQRPKRSSFKKEDFPPPIFAMGGGQEFIYSEVNQIDFPPKETLSQYRARTMKSAARGTWMLSIPHWLLLLATISAWIIVLMKREARWKRSKRAVILPES